MTELTDLTAVQLLDGYRKGEFSPVEATRAALERAEADPAGGERLRPAHRRGGAGPGPGVGGAMAAR